MIFENNEKTNATAGNVFSLQDSIYLYIENCLKISDFFRWYNELECSIIHCDTQNKSAGNSYVAFFSETYRVFLSFFKHWEFHFLFIFLDSL